MSDPTFEIAQIFEKTYPPEAALWCDKNRAYIEEITPEPRKEERQELVRDEVFVDAVLNEKGEEVTPAYTIPAEFRTYTETVLVRRFQIVSIPEPTLEELVERAYRDFDSRVEARLDAFAATRRYNSIYTAKDAKDSHIAKYAAEGQYCELMWGETYAKCEELLAEYIPDVLAGKRPIPAWEEIESQLPPLVWPDDQEQTPAE